MLPLLPDSTISWKLFNALKPFLHVAPQTSIARCNRLIMVASSHFPSSLAISAHALRSTRRDASPVDEKVSSTSAVNPTWSRKEHASRCASDMKFRQARPSRSRAKISTQSRAVAFVTRPDTRCPFSMRRSRLLTKNPAGKSMDKSSVPRNVVCVLFAQTMVFCGYLMTIKCCWNCFRVNVRAGSDNLYKPNTQSCINSKDPLHRCGPIVFAVTAMSTC